MEKIIETLRSKDLLRMQLESLLECAKRGDDVPKDKVLTLKASIEEGKKKAIDAWKIYDTLIEDILSLCE